jgi:GDP/UDP-N,N'-diacetylbacillosamine 2-epimerase (hydrolysing)
LKIALLTSSRADYSIYLPLLKVLRDDKFFDLNIIAFGTHLSSKYGQTLNNILADGFDILLKVDTMPNDDNPAGISKTIGNIIKKFSKVWEVQHFDLIIALGDRYEMFAACTASVPFNIPLAHIHGGETTLGAIDEFFRNSISHMASLHFTATEQYKNRVVALKGNESNIYNVGALSIDNLKSLKLFSVEEFRERFGIDMDIPSILITFHPETVSFEKNELYVDELISALKLIKDYQLIITMPNADTLGNIIRVKLEAFISENKLAIGVESFGTLGYLSCMKYCKMLLGNTSSGFIEAGYFPKYVINLGGRQSGRIITENIINCPLEKEYILEAVGHYKNITLPSSLNIYGNGKTAKLIADILKSTFII